MTTSEAANPAQSVTVRSVGTGYYFFELIGGRGEPFEAPWEEDESRLRIQQERIFVQSTAINHYPEIQLSAYEEEPPPADVNQTPVPLEVWGTWTVQLHKRVTVWSSDSYPADEKPLKLPSSVGDQYLMRVAVGYQDTQGKDIEDYVDDYNDEHDDVPVGIERFVIDFWPTA